MRLWSLHPKYLDAQGLVALWREALLARAVLRGETRGYRHHPQLERFRAQPSSLCAIDTYLAGVHAQATARGYSFDRSKLERPRMRVRVPVTRGQISHEWRHLMRKLAARSPALHEKWRDEAVLQCHPLFLIREGSLEPWERQVPGSGSPAGPSDIDIHFDPSHHEHR